MRKFKKRYEAFYGASRDFVKGQIPYLREKLSSLSEFMREIKVSLARYYNRRHNIGSKEFVSTNYHRFKHLFNSKHEKKPKPIKGLEGMYSLKRLSEVVGETCHDNISISR